MGEVWRGAHRAHGTPVALKVLPGAETSEDAFRAEVRAAAALDHPGIVVVFDCGTTSDGGAWLAMELVEGGTLKDRCGRLAWPELRDTLVAILAALAHAHARGVVHRDLKPGNVLL